MVILVGCIVRWHVVTLHTSLMRSTRYNNLTESVRTTGSNRVEVISKPEHTIAL